LICNLSNINTYQNPNILIHEYEAKTQYEAMPKLLTPLEPLTRISCDLRSEWMINIKPVKSIETCISEHEKVDKFYRKKFETLSKENKIFCVREVRGDGNCFYRSVGYAYLEIIVKKGPDFIQDFINLYFY